MPNYLYKATDVDGKWLSGEVRGGTREEAESRLLERGLLVESLTEAEAEAIAEPKGSFGSRQDLVLLVEQLADLTRSGLPLPSGLRAAGMEVSSRSLRSTFFDIANLVESGGKLDEALTKSGRRFPAHLRGLIAAGSRTGRLAEMLAQYVRGANLAAELRRRVLWTIGYPAIALVVVMAQVGFICSLSIKAVESLLGTVPSYININQKDSTAILIAMARLINDHGLEIVAGILAVPILAWATYRFAMGPARRRRLLCSIPVIGPILRFTSLTEFCHLMALLLEAETPLPLAFELAGSSVRDADVAEACGRMGRAVERGETLSVAMRGWESIPAGLGQLFRWSEDRRSLPDALRVAGDMFESRARSQSSFAGSVLATLLLLLILWWIGFAVATLYLPLFTLIRGLSG